MHVLRCLIAGLAASLTLLAFSTAPATADPVGNRSQDCKPFDELYASHGVCVTSQTPSDMCRSIESSLLEGYGAAYPYRMQIWILDADNNVAVPATPLLTVNHFGECMGAFAPWQIEWIAVSFGPA